MRSRLLSIFTLVLWVLVIIGCSDTDKIMDSEDQKMTDGDAANGDDTMEPDLAVDESLPLAPAFTLASTELEEVSLSDYDGKIVLLDFWATWCKPCEEEIPIFVELYERYRTQGFEVVGISLDEEGLEVVKPFIERLGVNYIILLAEPGIVEEYKLTAIPSAYLINRVGRIVQVFDGAQGEKAIYEKELQKLF